MRYIFNFTRNYINENKGNFTMKLSILIPVYNEEETLQDILNKVDSVDLKDIEREVVIVDDGSTDKSRDILRTLAKKYKIIFHKKNSGKGAAIRTAIKNATGDVLVIQDADLEYNPEDHVKQLELIKNGADVVYGSRFLGQTKEELKAMKSHYYGNKLLTSLTNILFGCKLTDMETCYKMFKKDVLKGVRLRARGFDLEPEITSKICKRGFKIKEVPISYNYRTFDEGKKITKIDGLKALYYLLKYRFTN